MFFSWFSIFVKLKLNERLMNNVLELSRFTLKMKNLQLSQNLKPVGIKPDEDKKEDCKGP